MEIREKDLIDFDAPFGEVQDLIEDIERLSRCLPGYQDVRRLDESHCQVKIKLGIGPYSIKSTFNVVYAHMQEEGHAVVTIEGEVLRSKVTFTSDITLIRKDINLPVTRMERSINVTILGGLEFLGKVILHEVVKQLISLFSKRLKNTLETLYPPEKEIMLIFSIIPDLNRFSHWSWYIAIWTAPIIIAIWSHLTFLLASQAIAMILFAFAFFAFFIMFEERLPKLIVFPTVITALAIGYLPGETWLHEIFYSVLCITTFTLHKWWNFIMSSVWSDSRALLAKEHLHTILGVGGQLLVVGMAIVQDSFRSETGIRVFSGAITLSVLTVMLVELASHHKDKELWQHIYSYIAGLLAFLVVPWLVLDIIYISPERHFLSLLVIVNISILSLSIYFFVAAYWLSKDHIVPLAKYISKPLAVASSTSLVVPLCLAKAEDWIWILPLLLIEQVSLMFLGFYYNLRIAIWVSLIIAVLTAMYSTLLF